MISVNEQPSCLAATNYLFFKYYDKSTHLAKPLPVKVYANYLYVKFRVSKTQLVWFMCC